MVYGTYNKLVTVDIISTNVHITGPHIEGTQPSEREARQARPSSMTCHGGYPVSPQPM